MAMKVYLGNEHCATLERGERGLELRYEAAYLARSGAFGLSRRLPLKEGVADTREAVKWFEGLLPEGGRRAEIAKQLGIHSLSTWSMLRKIGNECAGAVSVWDEDDGPAGPPATEEADEADLERALRTLETSPLGRRDRAARLSIAGAQPKLAMVQGEGGTWRWPLNGYPSTHILKPEQEKLPGLVHNEHTCMTLARRAGVRTAETRIEKIGEIECLVITRFDRTKGGERIHQEDLCQMMGREQKYQKDRGPSLRDYFAQEGIDPKALWEQVMYAYLIGDEDKHGKNFSVQYAEGGQVRLAPLYDSVCTLAFPQLDREMAWKIGNTYRNAEVTKKGIEVEARKCGLDPKEALDQLHDLAERVRDARAEMEKEGWNMEFLDGAKLNDRIERACEWSGGGRGRG